MNGDGKNDIVITDAEIPGGKVWWMKNQDGKGQRWAHHEFYSPVVGEPRRGAFHSLFVCDLDVFSCEMKVVAGDKPPRY